MNVCVCLCLCLYACVCPCMCLCLPVYVCLSMSACVPLQPTGVERRRSETLAVTLTSEAPVFDRNVSLSVFPWGRHQVVPQSTKVLVKVTGMSFTARLVNTVRRFTEI